MNRAQFAHRYTGARVVPFAPPTSLHEVAPAHCRSCGQPSARCRCGCRVCRTEPKELLVDTASTGRSVSTLASPFSALQAATGIANADTVAVGHDTAFVGGGCCVHISVEYVPVTPTATSSVLVGIKDAEGTLLAWQKTENAGAGYCIKENIITTNPGATVTVLVNNMTARVRWCEVFSC